MKFRPIWGTASTGRQWLLLLLLLLLLFTAIELSLGGSSLTLVQTKQIRINIHKRNNTKTQ